jgi:CheY-like chemotaxis protein
LKSSLDLTLRPAAPVLSEFPPFLEGLATPTHISSSAQPKYSLPYRLPGSFAAFFAVPASLLYPISAVRQLTRGGALLSEKKKPRTILVVEDVDEISLQMAAMLRKKGHLVLSATHADQAIRIAESNRPNMILTDLDLATFDSLVRLIRAHKDLSNMPVAIIDINNPDLRGRDDLKVLNNFDQLDELLGNSDSD